MGVSTPHLSPRDLFAGDPPDRTVIDRHCDADVRECRVLGHGKVALAEVLSRMRGATDEGYTGDAVLLPALVTDGVVGAVEAAGFDARFYRVRPDLGADLADLRAGVDDDTIAVVAVHYFGIPQPNMDGIETLAGEQDCYLVVDNAHSPLSSDDDQPLATTGDAGFASLHKQFPVPDGAVLTVSHPDLTGETARAFLESRVDPGTNGSAGSYGAADATFCAESLARFVGERARRLGEAIAGTDGTASGVRADGGGTRRRERSANRPSPEELYRSAAEEASGLTTRVLDRIDPADVVEARRRNYRYWLDSTAGADRPQVVYPDLPAGACPQVFPVLVDDPDRFCRGLPGASTPSSTWPPLPARVREDDDRFPVTNHLADRLVRLPVHQGLDVRDLAPKVAAVQEYRTRPSTGSF